MTTTIKVPSPVSKSDEVLILTELADASYADLKSIGGVWGKSYDIR